MLFIPKSPQLIQKVCIMCMPDLFSCFHLSDTCYHRFIKFARFPWRFIFFLLFLSFKQLFSWVPPGVFLCITCLPQGQPLTRRPHAWIIWLEFHQELWTRLVDTAQKSESMGFKQGTLWFRVNILSHCAPLPSNFWITFRRKSFSPYNFLRK